MSEANPYKPPESRVADAAPSAEGDFVAAGRAVGAGRGWEWITAGYGLFKKQAGMWILLLIIGVVVMAIVTRIPLLKMLSGVLFPVFAGGLLLGCKALDEEKDLTIGHLFAGFTHSTSNLVIAGVIWVVLSLVISVPIMLVFIGSSYLTVFGGGVPDPAMFGLRFMLGMLIVMALSVPVYMAMWFAPALIVFHELAPVDAMKTSFSACLKNITPFLIYGVILFVLGIAATIPIGLGWLVLAPVSMASIYTSYRDIFFRA